jgi:hypothetical protein
MEILFVIIGIICFECSFSQAKQDRISVDTIKFDGHNQSSAIKYGLQKTH